VFGFIKRKTKEVFSPVAGKIVALESVDDEVFSQKMVGDGVAVIPVDSHFRAPIDGIVTKIFSTNHAYSIKGDKDLEVMVHIGLESVALNGKGFRRIVEEGERVKAGDVIIEADIDYIKAHAKDIITPVIISDESTITEIEKKYAIVKEGDKIMEVK